MEIGIYTFADVGIGGSGVSPVQRIPDLIEEIARHHRGGPAP